MRPWIEPVSGRYLHLEIGGRHHRLYYEEAGQGIPLICLHTAGSDGRQYRGLLNDSAVTADFRIIAFDMPWHGKSSPPEGWQDEEYRLTTPDYTDMIMAVGRALELNQPVVMGCSIGGRVVLNLALEHADELRAVIGLQSSGHVDPYYDIKWLDHSDVHGGESAPATSTVWWRRRARMSTAGRPCGTTPRAGPVYSKETCTST